MDDTGKSANASEGLLGKLWRDYSRLNPPAGAIHELLESRGETVANDHIALRTYDDPRVGVDVLARPFTRVGYRAGDDYTFTQKKLFARHYEHEDVELPKVFISELQLGAFSDRLRSIVSGLVDQVSSDDLQRDDLPVIGRPWQLTIQDYHVLAEESEYAAWVAAFGFRANHFTVLVNALRTFDGLGQLNRFLTESGFDLNTRGGQIKGSPEVYLEQSSTLADRVDVNFTDGAETIPACYYEFARRYPLPNGELFRGFVAKSADKIFESTDRRGGRLVTYAVTGSTCHRCLHQINGARSRKSQVVRVESRGDCATG